MNRRGLCPTHFGAASKGKLLDGYPFLVEPERPNEPGDGVTRCASSDPCPNRPQRRGLCDRHRKQCRDGDLDNVRMIPGPELVDRALRSMAGERVEPLAELAKPRAETGEPEARGASALDYAPRPAQMAALDAAPHAAPPAAQDRAAALRRRVAALDHLEVLPQSLSGAIAVHLLDEAGIPLLSVARDDDEFAAETWAAIEAAITDTLRRRRADLEQLAFGGMP